MQINKIQQIPIINKKGIVKGLHVWNEITFDEERSNQIIVMAGGKGKRMLPYTKKCPKPLLTIGNKPIFPLLFCVSASLGCFGYSEPQGLNNLPSVLNLGI